MADANNTPPISGSPEPPRKPARLRTVWITSFVLAIIAGLLNVVGSIGGFTSAGTAIPVWAATVDDVALIAGLAVGILTLLMDFRKASVPERLSASVAVAGDAGQVANVAQRWWIRLRLWLQAHAVHVVKASAILLLVGTVGGGASVAILTIDPPHPPYPPGLAPNQTFTWPYVTATGQFGHNEVLDPAEISSLIDTGTISMLYIGLVNFSPTFQVQGDAAQSWDVDPTGTFYTFHLRPNLFFSDGKPITAADFAYSIDRALSPNLCSVGSAKTYNANSLCYQAGPTYLGHILGAADRTAGVISTMIANGDDPRNGLNVLDAQTLRIRLDAPITYFLDALTYTSADVLEKSFVQTPAYAGGLWVDHLDKGGTSGPFKLQSYGDGSKMTFVPNSFWEKAFGQQLTLKQVIRPAIASVNSEYDNYRSGAFDYTDVPSSQYSFARGQADFHGVPTLETDYFGLNTRLAPFDNLAIRQAFDLALNKQQLVDRVENGGAIPTNHIVPQGMPGFNIELTNPTPDGTQSLTGNQPAAISLLKKAQATCPTDGSPAPDYCAYITGTSPTAINLYVPKEDSTRVQLAQLAAQEWSNSLGVNVQAKPVSLQTLMGYIFKPAVQDPMAIWETGWIAGYPDPQDWLSLQFTSSAANNSEGYRDHKLDAMLTQADMEQDPTQRMQMYNQAEQIVVDASVWIPYQQAKSYWRIRSYVHGFGFDSIGLMEDTNWPKVYIAKH